MGLDVYLYKCEKTKKDEAKKLEAKYEKYTDKLWEGKSYDGMSETERNEIRKKSKEYATQLGLDEFGGNKNEKKIEINSSKYPDHLFKIGYFRSSYNDGGINHILNQINGKNLYDIFNPNDEYEFAPDWLKAREKAVEFRDKLIQFSKSNGGIYLLKVLKLGYNKQLSEKDVMDLVVKRRSEKHPFDTYSNRDGLFSFDKPLDVVSVIDTDDKIYLAIKGDIDNNPDEGIGWYIQAMEIVIETIDYVLSQDKQEDFYFHWSS